MATVDLISTIKTQLCTNVGELLAEARQYSAVDLNGGQSVVFILTFGGLDIPGERVFRLQESDELLTGFTDVAGDRLIPNNIILSTNVESPTTGHSIQVGYVGSKRYVRLIALTGTPVLDYLSGVVVVSSLLHGTAT